MSHISVFIPVYKAEKCLYKLYNRSSTIEVQHDPRLEGKSIYTFKKLCRLASEIIIAYSDKPLRLSIRIGFIISLLAFLAGFYLVGKALLFGTPVMGWGSLIVSLYFWGGIIISILGII